MTPDEVAVLLRMVRALCPAQRMDELTPDAWLLVLEPYGFDDAREALRALGAEARFIAPADLVAAIRRLRAARLSATPEIEPDADPDDVPAYLTALRAGRHRRASGLERPQPVKALLSRAFRTTEASPSPRLARREPGEQPSPDGS